MIEWLIERMARLRSILQDTVRCTPSKIYADVHAHVIYMHIANMILVKGRLAYLLHNWHDGKESPVADNVNVKHFALCMFFEHFLHPERLALWPRD